GDRARRRRGRARRPRRGHPAPRRPPARAGGGHRHAAAGAPARGAVAPHHGARHLLHLADRAPARCRAARRRRGGAHLFRDRRRHQVIRRESLLPLETYARERGAFRARFLEHKKNRTLHLGAHVTLLFEDELTIRYQVQEMLRIERIFEESGIQGELDAYNPLVPDGRNWKATMLIEYPDADERRRMLARLRG